MSRVAQLLYPFSLVVCQRKDGKFLLVHERTGWWLPGGGVDPGEAFSTAAIRETKEEAGVEVVLKGILKFEAMAYKPNPKAVWKQRMIFYAQPKDDNVIPKSKEDEHSIKAEWISYEQLEKDIASNRKKLRGNEPLLFFPLVKDKKNIKDLSIYDEIDLNNI